MACALQIWYVRVLAESDDVTAELVSFLRYDITLLRLCSTHKLMSQHTASVRDNFRAECFRKFLQTNDDHVAPGFLRKERLRLGGFKLKAWVCTCDACCDGRVARRQHATRVCYPGVDVTNYHLDLMSPYWSGYQSEYSPLCIYRWF